MIAAFHSKTTDDALLTKLQEYLAFCRAFADFAGKAVPFTLLPKVYVEITCNLKSASKRGIVYAEAYDSPL